MKLCQLVTASLILISAAMASATSLSDIHRSTVKSLENRETSEGTIWVVMTQEDLHGGFTTSIDYLTLTTDQAKPNGGENTRQQGGSGSQPPGPDFFNNDLNGVGVPSAGVGSTITFGGSLNGFTFQYEFTYNPGGGAYGANNWDATDGSFEPIETEPMVQ